MTKNITVKEVRKKMTGRSRRDGCVTNMGVYGSRYTSMYNDDYLTFTMLTDYTFVFYFC